MQNLTRAPFKMQFKIWTKHSYDNLIFKECCGGIYIIGIPKLKYYKSGLYSDILGIYGSKDLLKAQYDYINSFIK
jgi:hypothetical protein